MLRAGVMNLDAVLFTHEHRDHIAGLDDVRAFNFKQQKPMEVFTVERVLNALKAEFPYVFAEHKYPGIPQLNVNIIDKSAFSIGNLDILPVYAMHMQLPVIGFRIGEFAYLTDANYISEEEKEKLFGVKHFVVNALRKEKHVSHFTLDQALNLIRELSPKRAYITHISHQMGLHKEVSEQLPPGVFLACDGLSLDI
jgi:phosphoribosyl 1,2-cyclic phosphate phosphodiesterase